MRALITGASGFVGKALSHHLEEMGDEPVALCRSQGGPDITDRAAIHEVVRRNHVDVIFHLAAQAHVPNSWTDPIGTLRINAEGTWNVLDAAAGAGVSRVMVTTSAEVYGAPEPSDLPIDETAPLRPRNPYAASKVAADAIAQQSFLGRGQDVIRLRAFNHIGPGQRVDFVCSGVAHRIAVAERDGHDEVEIGRTDVRRDFLDVRDIARAYRLAALKGQAGEAYNVSSGVDRSIGEVADQFAGLSTRQIRFVPRAEYLRPADTPVIRGDASRLQAVTGWKPEIPFEQSLRDILADARERLSQTP